MAIRKEVALGVVIVVGLAVVLIASTLKLSQHKVEVCMSYNGRQNCATATGTSREEALRSGVSTACATISSGVTETIACGRTQPKSISWLE